MKKFLLMLSALSLVSTPALADPYGGYRGGYEHHEHHGDGDWIVPLFGGLILGGIIAGHSRDDHRPPVYQQPVYQPQYVCQNYYIQDQYGNYILDQYGSPIFTQRCWYQ